MTTAVYGALTWLAVAPFGLPAALGSLGSYAIAASMSYAAHRLLTFRNAVTLRHPRIRFTVVSVLGYLAALIIPALLTNILGTSIETSILATCFAIPLMNYLALSRFVFDRDPKSRIRA